MDGKMKTLAAKCGCDHAKAEKLAAGGLTADQAEALDAKGVSLSTVWALWTVVQKYGPTLGQFAADLIAAFNTP